VLWSLSLRYYAARAAVVPSGPAPPIRLFVVYHDPALTPRVPHSAGLDKGLIGVAHVFAVARMSGSNHVVVAHELLHTLGATDKYDPATDAPLFPDGFGDPQQEPRYPQARAEIMAGASRSRRTALKCRSRSRAASSAVRRRRKSAGSGTDRCSSFTASATTDPCRLDSDPGDPPCARY